MNVVIGIITCRRPEGLRRLLDGLSSLTLEEAKATILVVDNACEEPTEQVVKEYQQRAIGPDAVYLQEPVPGIVAARNRCVTYFLEQDADALAFIDDDEWPGDPLWMERLVKAMKRYEADVVTGPVVSVGEEGTPPWALEVLYPLETVVTGEKVTAFYTNNLLITRKVLEAVQPAFDSRFAMTGASDYHFALKCTRAGFNAVMVDSAVVEEFPADRATVRWFLRRGYRSGIGYSRSHIFEEGGIKAVPRSVLMSALRLVSGLGVLLKGVVLGRKGQRVKGGFRMASALGTITGLFGVTYAEYRSRHEV